MLLTSHDQAAVRVPEALQDIFVIEKEQEILAGKGFSSPIQPV
jgi:hypothetical protein